MSETPSEPDGSGESSKPAGLSPELERLFGFASPSWTERLRHALEPPAPGRLGRYEDLVEVGRGGQGEVYRAIQPGTGRVVALKRIAGLGLAPDPTLLSRFTREIDALTRLAHPNVVTVFAMEVIDGHSLLVMEFVDGRSIDAWADARWAVGDRPLESILRVFAEVCDGVAHAHQRGVLHRDLKPSNILVTADDHPKVLDFGIARVLSEQAIDGAGAAWTVTGFAGTPAYASPEQIAPDGGGIDTRADVYSLGIVLFRMLTGEEAFLSTSGPAGLLAAARTGVLRAPSRIRRGLPSECDWIVRKAADPDKERRYATVDALAQDVRRVIDRRAVLAHPPSTWYSMRRAIARRPWMSAAIAAVGLTVGTLSVLAAVQAIRLSVRSRELTAALEVSNRERARAEREEERQQVMSRRMLQAAVGAVNNETYFLSGDPSPLEVLRLLVDGLTPDDGDEIAVELHMRLGFACYQARRLEEAERELAAAQAISDRIDSPSCQRAVWIVLERCRSLDRLERDEERLRVVEDAIARAANSPRTIYSAVLHWSRMYALDALKRPTAEVRACAEQLLALCDEHPDRPHERAYAREAAANAMIVRGEMRLGETWARQGLEVNQAGRRDAQMTSRLRFFLAQALIGQERLDEAEPLLRAAADYRVSIEGAVGSRSHRYTCVHAELLHRLGKYDSAADAWERAAIRHLNWAKPDPRRVAQLRFRLAAARFGQGARIPARANLAMAISSGRTSDPDDAEVGALVRSVETQLRENGWSVDSRIGAVLGELSWLADPISPGVFNPSQQTEPTSPEPE